ILLDAPCSASGVARRHPDIRWNRRPSDLGRFAAQQAGAVQLAFIEQHAGKTQVICRGGEQPAAAGGKTVQLAVGGIDHAIE
ncbi:MAG: hypothetical protein HGA86_06835, partial [Anaerolineaceae bacterium]|nr:hypothetical protein [Anaerolineaceae bacterium]